MLIINDVVEWFQYGTYTATELQFSSNNLSLLSNAIELTQWILSEDLVDLRCCNLGKHSLNVSSDIPRIGSFIGSCTKHGKSREYSWVIIESEILPSNHRDFSPSPREKQVGRGVTEYLTVQNGNPKSIRSITGSRLDIQKLYITYERMTYKWLPAESALRIRALTVAFLRQDSCAAGVGRVQLVFPSK